MIISKIQLIYFKLILHQKKKRSNLADSISCNNIMTNYFDKNIRIFKECKLNSSFLIWMEDTSEIQSTQIKFHEIQISNLVYISDSAQKAIWASHIIKHIIQSKPPKTVEGLSLRDSLLNLELEPVKYKMKCSIRSQMLSIFSELKPFQDNPAFQWASQCATRIVKVNEQDFAFWPSYLVTQKVFIALLNTNENRMLIGQKGIGKTVSIFLFLHLSSIINTFIFEASRFVYKGKELQSLSEDNLIMWVPKYWYDNFSSFNPTCFSNAYYYWSICRYSAQATEISSDLKDQLDKQNFKNFRNGIRVMFNQAGIVQKYLADELDGVIAEFSEVNRSLCEGWINKDQEKRFQKMQKCVKYFSEIFKMGDDFVACANTEFQKELIQFTAIDQKRVSLNLTADAHRLPKFHISYKQVLEQNWARIDFLNYFWFQMEQNLKKMMSETQLIKQKQIFYNNLDKFQLSGNFSHELVHKFSEAKVLNEMSLSCKSINEQLKAFQSSRSSYQIHQFITKTANKTLLQIMNLDAARNIHNHSSFKVNLINLSQAIGQPSQYCFLSKKKEDQHLNATYDSLLLTIELNWTPSEFCKLMGQRAFPKIKDEFEKHLYYKKYWNSAYTESVNPYLCSLLNLLYLDVTFHFKGKDEAESQELKFLIYVEAQYERKLMFRNNCDGVSVNEMFHNLIIMAFRYPQQSILGVPGKNLLEGYRSIEHNSWLRWFDILLCRYDRELKELSFHTFFLITDSSQLTEVAENTQKLLQGMTLGNGLKLNWKLTHVFIFVDDRAIKSGWSIKGGENYQILLRAFDDIVVSTQDERHQGLLGDLKKVQEINKMIGICKE